jgi:N-hydroxyarylamine O-acetyltransferase
MSAGVPEVDLEAYCARIGHAAGTGRRLTLAGPPTLDTLEALHRAHGTHIPFENLDIQLGRPIRLDLASVQAKLVHGRRGGYCFEQNTLFAAVLRQAGFAVTTLAARVRLGTTRILPHTHMLLRIDLAGEPWLADVGFGSTGILQPLPLAAGQEVRCGLWRHRLVEEPGLWVLQTWQDGGWHNVYAFTLEPRYPVDFEMANHYVSTHPDSRFVQTLAVQLPTPDAQYLLRNREFTVRDSGGARTRLIEDDEELLAVLAETFGLAFPPGTRFRCLAARP